MGEVLLKEDITEKFKSEKDYVKWLLQLKNKKTGKQRFTTEQARSHAKTAFTPKKTKRRGATAETELYRLLSKKQYKTMLAKNDLTLQQVQKVLKNVIKKFKIRRADYSAKPKHSEEFLTYSKRTNLPQIAMTAKEIKDEWGGSEKPKGLKVSDVKFIRSNLFALKNMMNEKEWEVISKVTKIIASSPKQRESGRNMSLQEKVLNEVLLALDDGIQLTDSDRKKLKEHNIHTSKFLLKLDESMWKGKKTVHPFIIDKLIVHDGGKKKKTDLYNKFARFMKSEFGRGLPSSLKLRRVQQRIAAKKSDRATVPRLIKQLNEDKYKYSQANSAVHFNKLIKQFEKSISGEGKFYDVIDEFIEEEDGNTFWSIEELDTNIRAQYDELSASEKKGKDFDDFRAEKIIDVVQEIEEEYENVINHKSAIEKLEAIINDNSDKNVDESLTQFPELQTLVEWYEGLQENIADYNKYKTQAHEKTKQRRETQELHDNVMRRPKSDEEKKWEQEFFAEQAKELLAQEEREKNILFPVETRTVRDKDSPTGFKTISENVDLSRVKRFGKEKLTANLETMKDEVSETSLKGAETNLKNVEEKIQKEIDRFKQSADYRKLLRLINPGRGDPYYNKMTQDRKFKYQDKMDDLFEKFKSQDRMQRMYDLQKKYKQQMQAFQRIPQVEQLLENWKDV